MELQNLRYYVLCAKYLSFSRVAELCYTSQPTVSKSISALEAEIGGELFIRGSRKMELTDLGSQLLPFAEDLLDKEDSLRGFLYQLHTGQAIQPIVVGVSKMLLLSPYDSVLLPLVNAIESFKEIENGVDVKVRECEEVKLRELLHDKRIDLAVTAVNAGHFVSGFDADEYYLQLKETENYLIYPSTVEEISCVKDILPQLDAMFAVVDQTALSVTYDLLKQFHSLLPIRTCDNWSEVILKVKNGMGGAILSNHAAKIAQKCGLNSVSLKDEGISDSLVITWLRSNKRDAIADFAKTLHKWFCSSIQD